MFESRSNNQKNGNDSLKSRDNAFSKLTQTKQYNAARFKPCQSDRQALLGINLPSPIQTISNSIIKKAKIRLDIKRDDLIHPVISGNKWRKLQGMVELMAGNGITKLATMGGRYSNFLHALAFVAQKLQWQCDFYIRGYPEQTLTPTLKDIGQWGSRIHYVDRQAFKALRRQAPPLENGVYWLAEGGLSQSALTGFIAMVKRLDTQYDVIIIASATGTSVAGLALGVKQARLDTKVIGISVLNNLSEQCQNIEALVQGEKTNWRLKSSYEFSGFAKTNLELIDFMQGFEGEFNIPLEKVYSGKSFYATLDLIEKGYFPEQSRILLIHCGGLQGRRS